MDLTVQSNITATAHRGAAIAGMTGEQNHKVAPPIGSKRHDHCLENPASSSARS
jgi:hypothetical protein